jgi:hypothetical protein
MALKKFGSDNDKLKELKKIQDRIERLRALIDTDYKTFNLQFEVKHPEYPATLDRLISEFQSLMEEIVNRAKEEIRVKCE